MKLACIAMVKRNGKIIGVDQGRGITMPGGKMEEGETFVECARRELREETGLEGTNFKLIFQAPDGFGFYVLAFSAEATDFNVSGENVMVETDWEELKQSRFKAYYELMEMACASST